jgi:hypothetical protein
LILLYTIKAIDSGFANNLVPGTEVIEVIKLLQKAGKRTVPLPASAIVLSEGGLDFSSQAGSYLLHYTVYLSFSEGSFAGLKG